jgi:hypothetical protein
MLLKMIKMKTYSSHLPAPGGEETEEKFIFPDKEESIANAEGQLLDESGNTLTSTIFRS